MGDIKQYDISFSIYASTLDEEMKNSINVIAEATGWDIETIIRSAFKFGCKWYLKDQLNYIVDYQLGDKSRRLQ